MQWRWAFAGMAALGVVAVVILGWALPTDAPGKARPIIREIQILTQPDVLIAIATSALGSAAMFTLYTYIAPVLGELTQASTGFITLALMVVGLGFTLGNGLGGRLADWSLDSATRSILAALALTMLTLPMLLGSRLGAVGGLLAWGVTSFAIVPPLQARVMQAAFEAPSLASSINASAFNLGNALGAMIGGSIISFGFSYATVPVAGGLIALGSLSLAFFGRISTPPSCVGAKRS